MTFYITLWYPTFLWLQGLMAFHFSPPHRPLCVLAIVGRLGRGKKKRASVDGNRDGPRPHCFFNYFYSRWNKQREPLWRREVFHCILHLSLCSHYRIAFAPPQKSYRVGLLLTHKNGCDGAISLTERSCAGPMSKVDHHIWDRVCVLLWRSVNTDLFGPSRK